MSKIKIGAAVLEKDFEQLKKRIRMALGAVDFIQIDICDGDFVPSKTFGSTGSAESFKRMAKLNSKSAGTKFELELDMMVNLDSPIGGRFKKWLEAVAIIKPVRTVFHFGSTKHWDDVFEYFKKQKFKMDIGLGVHIHHRNSDILKLLNEYPFKYVQVMGIERVGFGGQSFSPKALNKIKALKKACPKLEISVDGAVKVGNAAKLIAVEVTRLASGSGLFKYDGEIKEAVRLMRAK